VSAGARWPRRKGFEATRPPDVSDARWQKAMRGLAAFVAGGWADQAERLGWSRAELYAAPPLWSRADLTGVALMIGDNEVTGVTPTEIQIRTASGVTQAFYRKPERDFGLVFRQRFKLIVGNVGSEEGRLRAIEHTVAEYRRAHSGVGLEDAKTAVLAAIAAKETTP
jgi:hypothetical protein